MTKRGNSFGELAQEVANQVGNLRKEDGVWVYKTIDGVWLGLSESEGVVVKDGTGKIIQTATSGIVRKRKAKLGRGEKPGETKQLILSGGAPMEMVWCDGFWMAKTEVTRRQWASVMKGDGSVREDGDFPIVHNNMEDYRLFCKLEGMELPSVTRWKKACLAGSKKEEGDLAEMGWFKENSGGKTHPVGEKKPNAWGLYDMYGNAWELSSDIAWSAWIPASWVCGGSVCTELTDIRKLQVSITSEIKPVCGFRPIVGIDKENGGGYDGNSFIVED